MAAAALQNAGVSTESTPTKSYTLEELKKRPQGIDTAVLESYLSPVDFKKSFGVTLAEFNKLPGWKKTEMKKKLGLH